MSTIKKLNKILKKVKKVKDTSVWASLNKCTLFELKKFAKILRVNEKAIKEECKSFVWADYIPFTTHAHTCYVSAIYDKIIKRA